jgi:hypothetical protein
MAKPNLTRVPITDAIRAAAKVLLDSGRTFSTPDRKSLAAIADPASGRQFIHAGWWRNLHGLGKRALTDKASVKLGQLQAMADPKRNPNPHERDNAARMAKRLVEQDTKPLPGSAPGLEDLDRQQAERAEHLRRWQEEREREMDAFGEKLKAEQEADLAQHSGNPLGAAGYTLNDLLLDLDYRRLTPEETKAGRAELARLIVASNPGLNEADVLADIGGYVMRLRASLKKAEKRAAKRAEKRAAEKRAAVNPTTKEETVAKAKPKEEYEYVPGVGATELQQTWAKHDIAAACERYHSDHPDGRLTSARYILLGKRYFVGLWDGAEVVAVYRVGIDGKAPSPAADGEYRAVRDGGGETIRREAVARAEPHRRHRRPAPAKARTGTGTGTAKPAEPLSKAALRLIDDIRLANEDEARFMRSFRHPKPGKMSVLSPEVFIETICKATGLSDAKVRGHLDAILDRILANHDKAAATASEPEPVNTAAAQPAEPARKPRKAKPAEPTKRVWAKRPGDRHKKSPDGKWVDRHKPGYMAEAMRKARARWKAEREAGKRR